MKKIILALFIFGAVVCAPAAKAEELGLTQEMIQQAQTDPEFKALIITYLQTIIQLLQEQLKVMVAQENTLNKIAQNTDPLPTAIAGNNAPIQKMPEANPFVFEPKVYHYPGSLVMTIAEKFDKCTLIIKDGAGNEVRKQDTWMTDNDGNARQVYSTNDPSQHTYSVTCSKGGFDVTTKTGNFPLSAQ